MIEEAPYEVSVPLREADKVGLVKADPHRSAPSDTVHEQERFLTGTACFLVGHALFPLLISLFSSR